MAGLGSFWELGAGGCEDGVAESRWIEIAAGVAGGS